MSDIKKLTEQANKYGSITVTLDVNEVMTLLKERDALADENAALSRYFSASAGAVERWNSWADAEDKLASVPETPATDAYLNSVRAEGAITILSELLKEISATGKGASRWKLGFIDYAWAVVAEKRATHSNQLRARRLSGGGE